MGLVLSLGTRNGEDKVHRPPCAPIEVVWLLSAPSLRLRYPRFGVQFPAAATEGDWIFRTGSWRASLRFV